MESEIELFINMSITIGDIAQLEGSFQDAFEMYSVALQILESNEDALCCISKSDVLFKRMFMSYVVHDYVQLNADIDSFKRINPESPVDSTVIGVVVNGFYQIGNFVKSNNIDMSNSDLLKQQVDSIAVVHDVPIYSVDISTLLRENSDTDGDLILDKHDLCPDEPGVYTLMGCPDSDVDGVPDHKDLCPFEKGSLILNGCPDTDGDGISDFNDECPNMAGVISCDGCPF